MDEVKDVTRVGDQLAPTGPVSSPSPRLARSHRIRITCTDDIVELLRCARGLCLGSGRDVRRTIQGSTAVVIARELARNVLMYTRGGSLTLTLHPDHSLELVAEDLGPGIERPSHVLERSLGDAGHRASGLGIAQRGASTFELSTSNRGTRVRATVTLDGAEVAALSAA